jgi:hypothetical protein
MNGPLPMPLFRRWARRHPGEDILVREQVRKWTPFGRSSLPSGRAGPSGVNVSQSAVRSLSILYWGVSNVPDHVHLLFLPPYSPELQPAEHLWRLTNTVLVNRHFASIEDLEDAQAAHSVALQARRDLVRSTTLFHCWPLRLRKRQAPR